jgi:two-component system, OmpR family, response regulator
MDKEVNCLDAARLAVSYPSDLMPFEDASDPARILVVDDDPFLQQTVVSYLERQHMQTAVARGRQEVDRQLAHGEPSLILLDLHLGQEDGLDLLREIRSRSDIPVIIVTGQRGDEIDRVVGLELGADDYLTKPFDLRELLARIRAVLRRRLGRTSAFNKKDKERGRFRFDHWQLDRRTRRLTDPEGMLVPLTKSEYALLNAFLDAPQRPLSRQFLQQATRLHEDVFDRSIDVQILRLRRKLELDPGSPNVILTARGIGYFFAPAVERL